MKSLLHDKHGEVITESGKSQKRSWSCTPVCPQVSKSALSKLKDNCCSEITRVGVSCQTLDPGSISKDEALSPYWNKQCRAQQSNWFLPHQTESPGVGSRSSKPLLNFMVEKSSFWKKTFRPKDLISKPYSVFSLASVTLSQANGQVEENACKKIRVYPSEPWKVDRQIDACRRAYNKCVKVFREWAKGAKPVDFTKLRREVREFVKNEYLLDISTTMLDEACQEAKRANQAVIRNRVKGKKSELRFRKKPTTKQGVIYQRLPQTGLPKKLGKLHITEEIPEEALNKQARLVREYGRYYLIVKKVIPIAAAKSQGNVVSIDPGVRTFATTYSPNEVSKLGEGFQDRLKPLGLQLDRLYSRRKRLWNNWTKCAVQFREDCLRSLENQMNVLRQKRSDLIDDLHKRVCHWLVKTYDIILLPTFEVKKMTSKEKRKIGSRTVRAMLDLCHYKFKQRLTWMCRKYGKTLIEVNEAYTSRTCSWSGELQDIGCAKFISDGSIQVDRDINGARGILLRALTR